MDQKSVYFVPVWNRIKSKPKIVSLQRATNSVWLGSYEETTLHNNDTQLCMYKVIVFQMKVDMI